MAGAVSRKGNRHPLLAEVMLPDNLADGICAHVKSPESLHAAGGLPVAKSLYNNNVPIYKFLYFNRLYII